MSLSNEQIERYSRQIIVPGVGGVAQEHLLTARLLIIGERYDVEPLLAYMVGAGVGEIDVRTINGGAGDGHSIVARMHDLNHEVSVRIVTEFSTDSMLTLAVAGSAAALAEIRLFSPGPSGPMIFTRLDTPVKVAILPAPPPCPICADADLFAPLGRRAENAEFVAMVAAAETFKVLARSFAVLTPVLLEFKGYESATRELSVASQTECGCLVRESQENP